ncbi:MarR family winged helix-turn-helix transcriptional regulator [Aeromicrobium sp. Root236]|uniref:MarR family winged helix-turn-helix transcriptional regulator n=1 Tax=Aeromicrobium sp. Root236 TaxID=1736498 RepID=UPI001F4856A7|nr:MarR family transcriptional regulator [Aeromicrobium sp. Root236]
MLRHARDCARAYRAAETAVSKALSPLALTTTRCLVLEALDTELVTGASIADLAAFLGLHRTSAAAVIDHLAGVNWVSRSGDARDARKTTIRITGVGRDRLAEARRLLGEA